MHSEKGNQDRDRLLEAHEEGETVATPRQRLANYISSFGWPLATFTLLLVVVVQSTQPRCGPCRTGYSTDFAPSLPAIETIEYAFTGGLDLDADGRVSRDNSSRPQYVGPASKDIDLAWNQLLLASETVVSGDEAANVRGKTYEETDRPGSYRFTLDVYHSLHCVNEVRIALNEAGTPAADRHAYFYRDHIDHCLDYLRQTIQCQSDLTPLMFEFSQKHHTGFPKFGGSHTCRDFSRIHDWALARKGLEMQADGTLSSHPGAGPSI